MTFQLIQMPLPATARLECSICHATCEAACDCNAPYLPAAIDRAAAAVAANPERSDRLLAAQADVDHKTVAKARMQSTGDHSPVRTGADGKTRRLPAPKADNSEPEAEDSESDIAPPEVVEENILYCLDRTNEHARVFKKFIKLSAFDREAVARISTAIDKMIGKFRSVQSTLTGKAAPKPKAKPAEFSDPIQETCDNCQSLEGEELLRERVKNSLRWTAETVNLPVTEEAVAAAEAAAAAWTKTAQDMKLKLRVREGHTQ
jgi:hypothetical protein